MVWKNLNNNKTTFRAYRHIKITQLCSGFKWKPISRKQTSVKAQPSERPPELMNNTKQPVMLDIWKCRHAYASTFKPHQNLFFQGIILYHKKQCPHIHFASFPFYKTRRGRTAEPTPTDKWKIPSRREWTQVTKVVRICTAQHKSWYNLGFQVMVGHQEWCQSVSWTPPIEPFHRPLLSCLRKSASP